MREARKSFYGLHSKYTLTEFIEDYKARLKKSTRPSKALIRQKSLLRYYYRNGQLDPEAAKQLSKLPNWSWGRTTSRAHSLEESVIAAECLKKAFGKIPSRQWLRKNGYVYVSHALDKHPERFGHLREHLPAIS